MSHVARIPITPQQVELLGVPVHNVTMEEAITRIELLIARGKPAHVVTPNVDHLVKLQHHASFRRAYDAAELVLADGMPLVWASRLLRSPLRAKVSGSDLFVAFAEVAAARGHRLYFLGGRPGAAAGAAEVLEGRHPGLRVCGVDAPPRGFERDPRLNAAVIARVRAARPDVLFVGLGAPKQELWIHGHREALGVPVSIGVGASFDFVAGMVRRAPGWMQQAGLEWLWRLLMVPRRLWRRYLVEDTAFLYYLSAQLLAAKGTSR